MLLRLLAFHGRAGGLLVEVSTSAAACQPSCLVEATLVLALVGRLYLDLLVHGLRLGLRQIKRLTALPYGAGLPHGKWLSTLLLDGERLGPHALGLATWLTHIFG